MRRIVGLFFLALVLIAVLGGGLYGLQQAFAEGESPVLPLLAIAVPMLAAGAVVASLLGWLIKPLRRGPHAATLKGLIALAVAASLEVGAYVASSDVPLQRPDAVVTAAVGPACSHTAVQAAGSLHTDGLELNHLVVLDRAGAEFGWTGKPSVAWRPSTVADVELVACIDRQDTTSVLEVCKYNGPDVTRYTARRTMSVVAARTGLELASLTVTSDANSCPAALARDVTELDAEVDWWEVEAHLTSLVERGVYVPPTDGSGAEPTGRPGPASTSAPIDVVRTTIQAGLADRLLSVTASGDSLQSLDLGLTSTSDRTLEITIPVGTLLVPAKASVQTMVVITSTSVDLEPGEDRSVTLDVACAQMHDAQPGESGKADRFTVQSALASAVLQKLLGDAAFQAAEFRVQQFAIWTITDNPTRSGYVHLGTFGVGSGPSTADIGEIKAIFRDAGIDASTYRALR